MDTPIPPRRSGFFSSFTTGAIITYAVIVLVQIVVLSILGYVLYHFITKFW